MMLRVRELVLASLAALVGSAACSGPDGSADLSPAGGSAAGGRTGLGGSSTSAGGTGDKATGTGGGTNRGGQGPVATGGTNPSGGRVATTGGAQTGGQASGGTRASGGTSTGGTASGGTATGGSATGGTPATGGASGGRASGGSSAGGNLTGGAASGGRASGGTATGGNGTGGTTTGGSAAGGTLTGGTASGGRATGGTATGGVATGGTATGGTATGGTTTCSPTWSPPASANGNTSLPAGLDQVWAHSGSTIMAADNIKIYQIMANKGSLNYCVRWDSTQTITGTQRDQIESLIAKCDKQWIDQLKDWGCWPYPEVSVKVSLWAVKNRSLLDWSDSDTTAKVVVNGDASCPSDCGPWSPNNSFPNCSSARYDEFFWLDGTVTTFTGWGSATGFMMGADSFLSSASSNASTYVILVHEMGHSHGLDDFYDWQPSGWSSWVMNAGSAQSVTETDGWMLRDVWRHVRSKYGYPAP